MNRDGPKGFFFSTMQSVASPVLGNILQQSKVKNGMRYIKIPGVPYQAAYAFIRFIYSSWYVGVVLFHLFASPISQMAILAKMLKVIFS